MMEHPDTDRNAVLFKRMAYFIECIAHADREGWNDATIAEARKIRALTTTPEPTDPAGVSEMAELAERFRRAVNRYRGEGCSDADDLAAFVEANALAILAALHTPDPVLEMAKEALERIVEATKYVENAYARDANRIANAALQTINERRKP